MAEKFSPAEIVKQITSLEDCPPSILILAKDEIRKYRIEKLLLDAFLPSAAGASQRSLSVQRVDGRELNNEALKRLREDISSLSLFAPRRFFIIHHVEALTAEGLKQVAAIIRDNEQNKLIIEGQDLPSSSPLREAAGKSGRIIELPVMEENALERWTEKELRNLGFKSIGPGVIELLIQISEESPDLIAKLTDHLALYKDGSDVKVEDLQRVFIYHTIPGEFDFINALAEGKKIRAEVLMQDLLRSGKPGLLMLALISKTFSNYLGVKSLLSQGLHQSEIQRRLNLKPYVLNKQASLVRNYSTDKLKRAMEDILRADSKFKNWSLGTEAIFSDLIHSLAPASKQR